MIKRVAVFVLLIIVLFPTLAGCGAPRNARLIAGSTGGNIPRDSYGEPLWRYIAPRPAPPQTPPHIRIREHNPRDISPAA